MERNEEIKCASKDYVNYLLDKQEYHNEDYTEDGIRQAFEKGAMFADRNPDLSSLWHSASEMPLRTSCEILYEMRSNYGFQVTKVPDGLTAENWENALKVCGIVRWAYVDVLLPKGGEK